MLLNSDSDRVKHMIDAVEQALTYARDCSWAELQSNPPVQHLLIRNLEILGEAASHISSACRTAHPEIPWRQIINTRNRLIHAYFEIDLKIVWDTVDRELSELLHNLQALLSEIAEDQEI